MYYWQMPGRWDEFPGNGAVIYTLAMHPAHHLHQLGCLLSCLSARPFEVSSDLPTTAKLGAFPYSSRNPSPLPLPPLLGHVSHWPPS